MIFVRSDLTGYPNTHKHTCISTFTHTHIYIYACIYIYNYIHKCEYSFMCIYIYKDINSFMYIQYIASGNLCCWCWKCTLVVDSIIMMLFYQRLYIHGQCGSGWRFSWENWPTAMKYCQPGIGDEKAPINSSQRHSKWYNWA